MTTHNREDVLRPERPRESDRLAATVDAWRWTFVRDALRAASTRFLELLRSIDDTDRPAVGSWSVGETAAHVRVVAALNSMLAADVQPPAGFEEIAVRAARATMSDVGREVNQRSLEWESRREPRALADAIEASVDAMLEATHAAKGAETVHWLGGLPLPRTAVFAHMVSELLVHGHDIAAGSDESYVIPSSEALRYFDAFMVEVVRNAPSVGFFDGAARDIGDVRWELRLRGGEPMRFEYVDGELRADATERPDVRITADPAAMLLVMYNRISPVGPACRGQLFVWGRRPWQLRRVTQVLRTP